VVLSASIAPFLHRSAPTVARPCAERPAHEGLPRPSTRNGVWGRVAASRDEWVPNAETSLRRSISAERWPLSESVIARQGELASKLHLATGSPCSSRSRCLPSAVFPGETDALGRGRRAGARRTATLKLLRRRR
jgi:hypothetical protein